MCIVFLWRREAGVEVGSTLKFILAANRDETFRRPAKVADYWEDHPHVLGGRDLTEGVSGGTWTGISRHGKVGFLTNIRGEALVSDPNKKGRGSLISDFLKNSQSTSEYFTKLEQERLMYRPFNLVCGDVTSDKFYYTNSTDEKSFVPLDSGFVCISNGTLGCKWYKVDRSREKFRTVVNENITHDNPNMLMEKLLTFLENTDRNYPDPNILVNNPGNEYLSSIFIPLIPEYQYGTRTNTIITVDNNNHVTFLERTKENLNDPVSKWRKSLFEFDVKSDVIEFSLR